MNELIDNELSNVSAGGVSVGIVVGIVAAAVFVVGIIDGHIALK